MVRVGGQPTCREAGELAMNPWLQLLVVLLSVCVGAGLVLAGFWAGSKWKL
jgi:hypothetical protein